MELKELIIIIIVINSTYIAHILSKDNKSYTAFSQSKLLSPGMCLKKYCTCRNICAVGSKHVVE